MSEGGIGFFTLPVLPEVDVDFDALFEEPVVVLFESVIFEALLLSSSEDANILLEAAAAIAPKPGIEPLLLEAFSVVLVGVVVDVLLFEALDGVEAVDVLLPVPVVAIFADELPLPVVVDDEVELVDFAAIEAVPVELVEVVDVPLFAVMLLVPLFDVLPVDGVEAIGFDVEVEPEVDAILLLLVLVLLFVLEPVLALFEALEVDGVVEAIGLEVFVVVDIEEVLDGVVVVVPLFEAIDVDGPVDVLLVEVEAVDLLTDVELPVEAVTDEPVEPVVEPVEVDLLIEPVLPDVFPIDVLEVEPVVVVELLLVLLIDGLDDFTWLVWPPVVGVVLAALPEVPEVLAMEDVEPVEVEVEAVDLLVVVELPLVEAIDEPVVPVVVPVEAVDLLVVPVVPDVEAIDFVAAELVDVGAVELLVLLVLLVLLGFIVEVEDPEVEPVLVALVELPDRLAA